MLKHCAKIVCLLALFAVAVPSTTRAAFVTLYDDTVNFSGFAYAGGGAATVGTSLTTAMIADDITAGPGLGGAQVTQFRFSVANLNSVAVTASVQVYFYNADATTAAPSTLITSLTFNPITFSAGGVSVYTYASPTTLFTMPTGLFWAGMSFSNFGGTTGATAAQLNQLGAGLFNPPTVGSSEDAFFQSDSAATNGTANPGGGLFFFGGNPVANFGWSFQGNTAAPVPEPGSAFLTAVALVVASGARLACRLGKSSTANVD